MEEKYIIGANLAQQIGGYLMNNRPMAEVEVMVNGLRSMERYEPVKPETLNYPEALNEVK